MTAKPTAPPPLTKRQQEVLNFVTDFATQHGYCCSVRDVMVSIGSASPNAAMCHLLPLRKKGFITWEPLTARSIRSVEVHHAAS